MAYHPPDSSRRQGSPLAALHCPTADSCHPDIKTNSWGCKLPVKPPSSSLEEETEEYVKAKHHAQEPPVEPQQAQV